MQITTYLAQYTGLPVTKLFDLTEPLVEPRAHVDGSFDFPLWKVEGKDPPTSDQVKAALAEPEPEPPAVVPDVISDRQFFQQLAVDGDITQDEALAAVTTGTLPQKLTDAVAALPAAQQFPAKMLCCGATEFHRSNPMVPVLGQALGKDAAALDAIWTAAAAL